MDVGVERCYLLILLLRCPHHYWNNVMLQGIVKKLLCDIVFAVHILKSQIKLVVPSYLLPAMFPFFLLASPVHVTTFSIDIHINMLGQFFSIPHAIVFWITVGHKPGHRLVLPLSIILLWRQILIQRSIVKGHKQPIGH